MSIPELCLIHRVGRHEPRQRSLALLGDTEMTTDLKTVWLKTGTVVKILDGSRQGYIGEIIDVLHLSVEGCIYKVLLNVDIRSKRLAQLYTQDQVVEYAQQEGGVK